MFRNNAVRLIAMVGLLLTSVSIDAGAPPRLVSIAVTPVSASIQIGAVQQFDAIGTYSDGGTKDVTKSVTWTSSDSAIATVSNTGASSGRATGNAAGTVQITATLTSISSSATLTVTAPALVSIAVTPASPSIVVGQTQQFTATGTYTNGSTQDLTASVTWTSGTPATATIAAGGLATSLAAGTTLITATSGAISGSTTLTVTAATLVSIAVTPASPSIVVGQTEQFTATGTYANGSTQNLTASVTWTSGTPATATITTGGLATSVAAGTTLITATSGAISGSTTLTVTAPALVSIAVTPASPSILVGQTQQFTATGTFSNGSTQNLTASVTWTSGTPATATIAAGGLATSLAAGTTLITATSGAISGSTTLTVTAAALVSIAVTPASPSIVVGQTQQFTATGTFSNGSTQNLTASVTWTSDTPATATIAAGGLATSVAAGTTLITATSGAISASTTLTVTSAALVSIAVTPASPSIVVGQTQQFTATGTFSNGSTQNLTASVTWTSGTPATATIAAGGLATSLAAGTTLITATSGAISGSTTLTVTAAALSISCPANVTSESPDGSPVAVTYPAPLVTGGVPPLTMESTPESGSLFPVQSTAVIATVTDSVSNVASCSFFVTVSDDPPPAGGFLDPVTGPYPVEPNRIDVSRTVRMKSPNQGMHFTAGLPMRLLADASTGEEGLCPPFQPPSACTDNSVTFYVDGVEVGTIPTNPEGENHWELRLPDGLAAGTHQLTMMYVPHDPENNDGGPPIQGMVPVTIHVDPEPDLSNVIDLTEDIVLSGDAALLWENVLVRGHGHRVYSDPSCTGYSGSVTIRNSFVTGLGSYDARGIDVCTTGGVTLEHSIYEATGIVHIEVNGGGPYAMGDSPIVIHGNEWRANNFVTYVAWDPDRTPVLEVAAHTYGSKTFTGNNVGAGFVFLRGHWEDLPDNPGWQVGGLTRDESNVFIGPRDGLMLTMTYDARVQGNYMHHDYQGGWSQGQTFGSSDAVRTLSEHNVFRQSSWVVQGFCGMFRYNLVIDEAGDDGWRTSCDNTSIDHSVFLYLGPPGIGLGGEILFYTGEQGIAVTHTTLDLGGQASAFGAPGIQTYAPSGLGSVIGNVFTGFIDVDPAWGPAFVAGDGLIQRAGFNGFYNPDAPNTPAYRPGAVQSVVGPDTVSTELPQFARERDAVYAIQEGRVWNREISVFDVLHYYRQMYSPAAGSPLIGSGPDGTNQGAISGDSADRFGTEGAQ